MVPKVLGQDVRLRTDSGDLCGLAANTKDNVFGACVPNLDGPAKDWESRLPIGGWCLPAKFRVKADFLHLAHLPRIVRLCAQRSSLSNLAPGYLVTEDSDATLPVHWVAMAFRSRLHRASPRCSRCRSLCPTRALDAAKNSAPCSKDILAVSTRATQSYTLATRHARRGFCVRDFAAQSSVLGK